MLQMFQKKMGVKAQGEVSHVKQRQHIMKMAFRATLGFYVLCLLTRHPIAE